MNSIPLKQSPTTEKHMPYVSFCIALYAQWLDNFQKAFAPPFDFFAWAMAPATPDPEKTEKAPE